MTARDWLAKRAELEAAAPSAPWTYTEGADGNPADGPTFTALVASHPTLGERTIIAQGDYDSWSGYALIFAADARTSAPAMRKALEAVLDLHKSADEEALTGDCAIEECEHEDDCPTTRFAVCRECWRVSEEADAYFATRTIDPALYPCPTVAKITTALGVES